MVVLWWLTLSAVIRPFLAPLSLSVGFKYSRAYSLKFPFLSSVTILFTISMDDDKFPRVEGGGSLILAWQIRNKRVLVVGGGEVSVVSTYKALPLTVTGSCGTNPQCPQCRRESYTRIASIWP